MPPTTGFRTATATSRSINGPSSTPVPEAAGSLQDRAAKRAALPMYLKAQLAARQAMRQSSSSAEANASLAHHHQCQPMHGKAKQGGDGKVPLAACSETPARQASNETPARIIEDYYPPPPQPLSTPPPQSLSAPPPQSLSAPPPPPTTVMCCNTAQTSPCRHRQHSARLSKRRLAPVQLKVNAPERKLYVKH